MGFTLLLGARVPPVERTKRARGFCSVVVVLDLGRKEDEEQQQQ